MKNLIKPIDIISIAYMLITAFYIFLGANQLNSISSHLIIRLFLIVAILLVAFAEKKYPFTIITFIRNFYPLALFGWFYGETAFMNNIIFDSFDLFLSKADIWLFGFEPSIEFSKNFSQYWFNELMNFGYFSYYFLTFIVCLVIYITNRKESDKVIFIISLSFYIYYLIFSIFPAIGPQFYFNPALSQIPDAGFFRESVKFVQSIGEQPTGAFPSSHIGMSIIFLILSKKYAPRLFWYILPLIFILFPATVYIKAHYFIDVIAGIISAPFIYLASIKTWKLF